MTQITKLSDAYTPRIDEMRQKLHDKIAAGITDTELAKMTNDLTKMINTRNRLLKSEVVEEPEADDYEDRQAAMEVLKADIRNTLLKESDYYYIHDMEKFLLYRPEDNSFTPQSERSLKNHHAKLVPGTDYWHAFIDVLKEENRWFFGRTSSFKDEKGKLNMLRPTLVELVDGAPHPIFDIVVRSVCGDKPDNIEHLEKVLVAKWVNPFQYLLPVICFSDNGGTGKSLFVSKVVTTMFGRASVNANCKMGDFAGQFNGHLSGKLAILINENCEDSYNHNAIKQIAGSPSITFTNKNQMPYEGDNSALLFVSGNSIAGSIRVDGGDVDRRFSMIKGTRNLEAYVSEWLTATTGKSVSYHQAKDWIIATGQDILSDPQEVGKWLNSLINRHGRLNHVAAHHGADYQSIVSIQTSLWDQVFETIFDSGFTYVRKSVLYDFYRYEAQLQGNRSALGKKKFYHLAEVWLEKRSKNITAVTANWDNSTADVFISVATLGGLSKPKLRNNDGFYFIANGNQREWKVAL